MVTATGRTLETGSLWDPVYDLLVLQQQQFALKTVDLPEGTSKHVKALVTEAEAVHIKPSEPRF